MSAKIIALIADNRRNCPFCVALDVSRSLCGSIATYRTGSSKNGFDGCLLHVSKKVANRYF